MRKNLFLSLLCFSLLCLPLSISSCGSDDNDSEIPTPPVQPGEGASEDDVKGLPIATEGDVSGEYTDGKFCYKVTSSVKDKREVAVLRSADLKKAVSLDIPAAVAINGKRHAVTEIAEMAFVYENDGLGSYKWVKSVTIPGSVRKIGEYAFFGCEGIEELNIPASVETIGSDAFTFCSNLKKIAVEKGNKTYDSRDNSNAIIETSTNTLVYACMSTVIPSSVRKIGPNAYYGVKISRIVVPEGVTHLDEYAFANCYTMTSVSLPSTLVAIGDYAFADCGALSAITLPKSLKSIGEWAFLRVKLNTVLSLNPTPPSLGEDVFYWNSPDCILYVPSGSRDAYIKAWPYDKEHVAEIPQLTKNSEGLYQSSLLAFRIIDDKEHELEVVKPVNVQTLVAANIPGMVFINGVLYTVTSIGQRAFCLPSSNGGYDPNKVLRAVTIPGTIRTINASAFFNCAALKEIEIPSSVESIVGNPFYGCTSLEKIEVDNNNSRYFSYINCIVDFTTGTVVTGCGNSSLPALDFVKTIGIAAFRQMPIEEITIPANITSIEKEAFFLCSDLKKITSLNPTPPSLGQDVFSYVSPACIVYVPKGSRDAYIQAWPFEYGSVLEIK